MTQSDSTWSSPPLELAIVVAVLFLLLRLLITVYPLLVMFFLIFPPIAFALLALFPVSLTLSVVALVSRFLKDRSLNGRPLAVNLATLAVLWFVPFTSLWLDIDYHWHRAACEKVVEEVRADSLKPNVSYNASLIRLDAWRSMSSGGSEIVVRDSPEGSYVLFYTFRGILNHYSGFLNVPEGGTPKTFDQFVQVVPYGSHWFFVAQ